MTLARAFVTGVVVKAPEKRFTQNDMAIAGFTINIDTNNETLLRVVAFGNLADVISSTVQAGDSVAVEGRLQANTYKLPNGKDKKIFEINANTVEKISGSSNAATNPIAQSSAQIGESENIVSFNQDEIAQDLIDEDEIPF
ncbi:MAG: single-stranded DNA-binding protein [Candidatus Gastranaerophilales bacterium]|nr:single-stranded DNA-binding protein [Candidatus Gastranaerophilales bacterium]